MTEMCAECGEFGTEHKPVNRVSIAWPGTKPFYVEMTPHEGSIDRITNPYADGHAVELWLHHACEAEAIARIEKARLISEQHAERKP